jgi:ADP-heptose:LPS heptosyltransferase
MSPAQRILIYRLGSLGDNCVALPSYRVVRRHFPQARITMLTNLPVNIKAAPAPALLAGTGLVDDYLAYPVGTRSPWKLAALAWRLRRRGFEAVVNLAAWRGARALQRDARFFRVCGLRRLVGFDSNLGHELRTDETGDSEHEAVRLLRRVATLGRADLADRRWYDLYLTANELHCGTAILNAGWVTGAYLAFSVGTKATAKDWGRENWRELIRRLRPAHGNLGCVFIGSPDEAERSRECMEDWSGPTLNLSGRTSPRGSAAILAGAQVFVGHDSGPMHLAAAVGTPCVAIFAARSLPGQWFPLGEGHEVLYRRVECMGCGLDECIAERKRCIRGITVDEVAAAVTRQIERRKERSASEHRTPGPMPPSAVR